MSQETASSVTEPLDIDLFEFLCVVNEGESQDSNELLHNQHARARHLRATSTSEAKKIRVFSRWVHVVQLPTTDPNEPTHVRCTS